MTTKRILDDETRKALLGSMPFSANATIEFTPEKYDSIDIEDQYKPVYTLRGMTTDEKTKSKKASQTMGKNDEAWKNLTRGCINGFKNIFDLGTKEEIEYKSDPNGGCDKDIFDRINEVEQVALFMHVCTISNLFNIEKKGLK